MESPAETIEDRLEQLEVDSLRIRLEELSARVEQLGPQPGLSATVKDLFHIFTPFLTPVVVAWIGIWATTSVTSSIDQRQLELAELTSTLELIKALGDPDVEYADAEAEGAALAAFGPSAIEPLILQLQVDRQVRPLAADHALRAIAVQHPNEVCTQLRKVLRDESRFFTWKTHKRAIEMLGDIRCVEAQDDLEEFQEMLNGKDALTTYQATVSGDAPPTKGDIDKLNEALNHALKQLER